MHAYNHHWATGLPNCGRAYLGNMPGQTHCLPGLHFCITVAAGKNAHALGPDLAPPFSHFNGLSMTQYLIGSP
eukprot:1143664-Pelagomonas_calceolata.AAC.2